MIYCDTAYLVKYYIRERGTAEVRELINAGAVSCLCLGKAELASALHRKWRDGFADRQLINAVSLQYEEDDSRRLWRWLPLSEQILEAVQTAFRKLPRDCFVRAADALHLVCARDNGFKEVYSNDERFLAAAPLFGLKAKNVVA